MKALGLKVLEQLSLLYRLGAITQQERCEYAKLTNLAMYGRPEFFVSLKRFICKKQNDCQDAHADEFTSLIEMLPDSV